MTFVKMCGTWYRYPERTMSNAEHREFQAVVNVVKEENGQQVVFSTKATKTEIFELGQLKLDELDEWELNDDRAAREVKVQRLMQIVSQVMLHQEEARGLCDELFADDVHSAVREVFRVKPGKNYSEGEITHLFHFFGMPSDD